MYTASVLAQTGGMTPLQLRMMQTRKFSKPIGEVVEAIKTGGEDAGANCHIYYTRSIGHDSTNSNKAEGTCIMAMKQPSDGGAAAFIPFIGGIVSAGAAINSMKEMKTAIHSIKYEVTSNKPEETILRMRAYSFNQSQITDSAVYSNQFKIIGDALFIKAIELTPSEQE